MNILTAAERLAAIDRSQVRFDPVRCLHAQDRFSTCAACYDLCPVDSIQAAPVESSSPPVFNDEACVTCLACLPACPVGAYTADDAVPALLNCLSRLDAARVELLCELHPAPETGLPGSESAVQVRGCLAGLGAAAYLSLALVGVEQVTLRLDACPECPVGRLQDRVESCVKNAQSLLALWEGVPAEGAPSGSLPAAGPGAVQVYAGSPEAPLVERPWWSAGDPPLSRRDLFRLASRQGQIAAARAVLKDYEDHSRTPGRERRRLLAFLSRLGPAAPASPAKLQPGVGQPAAGHIPNGFGWASLQEGCSACGVCARACPTGALLFDEQEAGSSAASPAPTAESFTLAHDPRLCIGCETCVHVCAPGVICIDTAPDLGQVLAIREPLLLLEGEFQHCTRCKARFAARNGAKLCPVCEFRRKNPFGAALPPALLGRPGLQDQAKRLEKTRPGNQYDH